VDAEHGTGAILIESAALTDLGITHLQPSLLRCLGSAHLEEWLVHMLPHRSAGLWLSLHGCQRLWHAGLVAGSCAVQEELAAPDSFTKGEPA
jgi:hypothetical protein